MWRLEDLKEKDTPQVCIDGQWVPARPLNYQRKYMPLINRFKDAWAVFWCKAEAFKWPHGQ